MPIQVSKIEELAPDQSSLAAAAKLKKASQWSLLASDGVGLIWGECQGSGASPYRVICAEADYGYKCTCPSRKFPCKHTLALMWMRADAAIPFKTEPVPDWVGDWLARRRPGAASPRKAEAGGSAKASAAQADDAEQAAEDPKAAARAAAQRERNRVEREAAILGGLDELDIWIADALRGGLASFMPAAHERCRKIAQRLVDAKAPGLAGFVENLPAALLSLPEAMRTDALIERLATLHVMSCAYRNQARLPDAVRADIRQAVGWPVTREALLSDPAALRVRDRWMVMSTAAEAQADRLFRLETWLSRLGEGAPRCAVLLDFVPVSLGKPARTYSVGEVLDAELAFFHSPAPLRAVIVDQTRAAMTGERWSRPPEDVGAAIVALRALQAARPWSAELPFAARGARVVMSGTSLWLTDAPRSVGLPLRADDSDAALPLLGLDDIDAFGRWDGHFLTLGLCETALGRWTAS